jgi:hypothetical protein
MRLVQHEGGFSLHSEKRDDDLEDQDPSVAKFDRWVDTLEDDFPQIPFFPETEGKGSLSEAPLPVFTASVVFVTSWLVTIYLYYVGIVGLPPDQ